MRLVILLLILLVIPGTMGAVIQGTVYDFSLDEADAVVSINTSPQQKKVTSGQYSFQVPAGRYTLTASDGEATAEENITVNSDGTFTIDLIMFPNVDTGELDEEEDTPPNPNSFEFGNSQDTVTFGLAVVIVLLMLMGAYYLHFRKPHEARELDEDAQEIYDFIRSEKRTTQKDIRKKFNYSQAKISLMLTELEDKELIKKVKKGRGNVIILN